MEASYKQLKEINELRVKLYGPRYSETIKQTDEICRLMHSDMTAERYIASVKKRIKELGYDYDR